MLTTATTTTTAVNSAATRKTTTMMTTTTKTTGVAAATTRNMNITKGSGSIAITTNSVSRGLAIDTETATATTRIKTREPTTQAATTAKKTTITSDPGILCFHHCNVKVFCFTLPHICPQCKTALLTVTQQQQHHQKQRPNGDGNTNKSSTGVAASGGGRSRRNKTKNKTKLLSNKNSNNYNTSIDHSHTIDSNKDAEVDDDDNDGDGNNANNFVRDNGCSNHNDNNNDDDVDNDDDANNTDDTNENDDDDENDLNRNSFTSQIMASRLLPFRLPYPFVRANQYPCAIVLRPTTGDFLNDYNNTTDLHIAVTTSTGCVVEFDRHGLRRHRTDNMSEWWQCLLVGDVPEPWYDYWDQVLFEICQQPDKWTVSHYHEDKHNCYTFVLTFLQALTYDKLSEAATSKTRFCEKYIVPRTTTAGKYISLYRKLRDADIYVHHTNHQKQRYAKQQKQQLQQQHQQLQRNPNKSNNLTTTTAAMTKNCLATNKQQQYLSNHHNHHSIISRPHSTLCTIEE